MVPILYLLLSHQQAAAQVVVMAQQALQVALVEEDIMAVQVAQARLIKVTQVQREQVQEIPTVQVAVVVQVKLPHNRLHQEVVLVATEFQAA
jgi:hypothetical protein